MQALGRGREDVEWLVAIDHDGMRAREPIFEEVRARWDIDAPVAQLVERYRSEYPAFVPAVDPEVARRLAGLRRGGWRIAVVTNGPPSQQVKMERCGLLPLVDVVVISDVLGVSKPDRRIFEAAARQAGCKIDAAWLVGDSPEADIAAAVEIGDPGGLAREAARGRRPGGAPSPWRRAWRRPSAWYPADPGQSAGCADEESPAAMIVLFHVTAYWLLVLVAGLVIVDAIPFDWARIERCAAALLVGVLASTCVSFVGSLWIGISPITALGGPC